MLNHWNPFKCNKIIEIMQNVVKLLEQLNANEYLKSNQMLKSFWKSNQMLSNLWNSEKHVDKLLKSKLI